MENVDTKFRITYDDSLMNVVFKISSKLELLGLTIKELEGSDEGWEEYEIVKLPIVEPIIEQ
jgi:hypothetical protein